MGITVTKESKAEFAEKLKNWRKRENLTQTQAAKTLGVSVRTLQNWEIARTKPASMAERLLLATIQKKRKKVSKRKVRSVVGTKVKG